MVGEDVSEAKTLIWVRNASNDDVKVSDWRPVRLVPGRRKKYTHRAELELTWLPAGKYIAAALYGRSRKEKEFVVTTKDAVT